MPRETFGRLACGQVYHRKIRRLYMSVQYIAIPRSSIICVGFSLDPTHYLEPVEQRPEVAVAGPGVAVQGEGVKSRDTLHRALLQLEREG